jgi:hypothetical protein
MLLQLRFLTMLALLLMPCIFGSTRTHHLHLPEWLIPHQKNNDNQQLPLDESEIANLARQFERVLDKTSRTIHVPNLLRACQQLEHNMRRVGQTQSARDLHGNIKKVQALTKSAPRDSQTSLLELLAYEKNLNIHAAHAVLKDPSGAIGALWIRRAIAFQTQMYTTLLDDPSKEPKDAGMGAYKSVLAPFHGWTLQHLYGVGIAATTPPRKQFLATLAGVEESEFGPRQEAALQRDLRQLVNQWEPLLEQWRTVYAELELEDTRRV